MINMHDATRLCVVVRENNRIARSAFVKGRLTRHFPLLEKGQIRRR